MSWLTMINKDTSKIEKKKIVNENALTNEYLADYSIETEFNYKYGDNIFNDICTFFEENEHDNHILSCIEPSFLYDFFVKHINKEDYYEFEEDVESPSESDEYSD